jgi:hypothetical protein
VVWRYSPFSAFDGRIGNVLDPETLRFTLLKAALVDGTAHIALDRRDLRYSGLGSHLVCGSLP